MRLVERWLRRGTRLLVRAALAVALLLVLERLLGVVAPPPLRAAERFGRSREALAADGTVLRVTPTASGERLLRVPLDRVSPHVVHALLASEDGRFFGHGGADLGALVRATAQRIVRGRVISGGSTLTMQLARTLEPRPRSVWAKLCELVRARQIEREWSKERILTEYLNLVPWGGTLRGVEAAARYWFGKHAAELLPAEAATLVAMLPGPSRRAPDQAGSPLHYWRDHVLERKRERGALSRAEFAAALQSPLRAVRHPWPDAGMQATQWFLDQDPADLVHTTLDVRLQEQLEALATGTATAGDGLAVVVRERPHGHLRALVGARDGQDLPLSAAGRRRSTGSTLKPFLYALALDLGITGIDSILADEPMRFRDWEPTNFGGTWQGAVHARTALAESRNLPAVRLLQKVGADAFADLLRELGLRVPGPLHLDAALGTLAASPLELALAYARFVDGRSGLRDQSVAQVLEALRRLPLRPETPGPRPAWKTGTSHGRRDAWCCAVTERFVAVVWCGNLAGHGDADLVGARSAAPAMAEVLALLAGQPPSRSGR
jgi:penicillin-binding protein 1C